MVLGENGVGCPSLVWVLPPGFASVVLASPELTQLLENFFGPFRFVWWCGMFNDKKHKKALYIAEQIEAESRAAYKCSAGVVYCVSALERACESVLVDDPYLMGIAQHSQGCRVLIRLDIDKKGNFRRWPSVSIIENY